MDLSRYNIDGRKEAADVATRNNKRLVAIRWAYMFLVCGIASATTYFATHDQTILEVYGLLLLFGLTMNSLFFAAVLLRSSSLKSQYFLTISQILLDFIIAGLVTYVQGGIEARTTVLFMFPIMASALIFKGYLVMYTALIGGAVYAVTVYSHEYINNLSINWSEVIIPIIFYPAVFLLLARVTMFLEHIGTIEAKEKAYDSFLSLIAHQLKHPASAATTILDAATHNEKANMDHDTKHYIDLLKAENENQLRLIDNLLEAAPRDKPVQVYEPVNVSKLMDKIASRVANAYERAADLHKTPEGLEDETIEASSNRLSLALTNVFDNAFRYSKEGEKIKYSVTKKSSRVVLTIRDNGIGMKKEDVSKQMERFSMTGIKGIEHGHVGGLGLGLYAASKIIYAHDGEINIHSSESIGTTVQIKLKIRREK